VVANRWSEQSSSLTRGSRDVSGSLPDDTIYSPAAHQAHPVTNSSGLSGMAGVVSPTVGAPDFGASLAGIRSTETGSLGSI